MNRDSAPMSKSTVTTACSAPSAAYTGSTQVRPVVFDVKYTRGGVHVRRRVCTASVKWGRVRTS